MSEELRIVATCPKCKSVFDVIKQSNKSSAEQERKQGAVDALNSVEFRQSLLQAKVTELEKIKSNFLDERHEYLNKETIQIKEYIELRLKELKG
jgi:hypothetical protein